RMPNTPGSRRSGEAITGIGRSRSSGVAGCMAARKRRHQRYQTTALIAKPQNQTLSRTTGSGFDEGAAAAVGTTSGGRAKGWLIWSIAREAGDGPIPGDIRHAN